VKKLALATVAAALLAAGPAARAQDVPARRWGSVELGAGPFVPNIDAEFHGAHTPYRDIFGGKPGPMFRVHVGKALWSDFGTIELGFKTGYFSKSGHAVASGVTPLLRTGDRASINILPTSLTLTYRMDNVWESAHVPVVPYARVALERYNWWTTKQSKWTKKGATNGWSASLGLVVVLDWLDPAAAREAGNEIGISHTGLYLDVTKSTVNDFGSNKSWDMSNKNKLFWSGGLLVTF
jgi:hypothetical protein